MASIYYYLIQNGLKTLDDVPDFWKEAVRAIIDENMKFRVMV